MKITSINANINNTTIAINGTVEPGMLAAQIIVYDEKGENVIVMQSTDVAADNTFSAIITVPQSANYIVKAADYDGGEYSVVAINTDSEGGDTGDSTDESTAGTPETGYHTITKPEPVTPETNASFSPSPVVIVGAVFISLAIMVFGIKMALKPVTKNKLSK